MHFELRAFSSNLEVKRAYLVKAGQAPRHSKAVVVCSASVVVLWILTKRWNTHARATHMKCRSVGQALWHDAPIWGSDRPTMYES